MKITYPGGKMKLESYAPSHRLLLLCLFTPTSIIWMTQGATAAATAVSAAPAAEASRQQLRPGDGCPTRCGEVDIPFPFGVGERCALGRNFNLTCATVNGTTMPLLWNLEVTKISVRDAKLWTKNDISWLCYDPTKGPTSYTYWMNLSYSPYSISEVDNRITIVGCNTLGYMFSSSYVVGCLSTCNNVTLRNGSCSGAGCCQVDIPKDITYYYTDFNYNFNTSRIWQSNRCGYMALIEKAAFSFDTSYVRSEAFWNKDNGKTPVVLSWHIPAGTCDVARNNTSVYGYACVSNHSECVNSSSNDPGYLCKCSDGFKGSPYVADGCQDIDECRSNPKICANGICENTLGNFSCSCNRGYEMMDGVCTKKQKYSFPAMPVVGASVGLVVLMIVITGAYLFQERRKLQRMKHNFFRQHGGMLLFEEMNSQQGNNTFRIFTEEELQQATNRFSDEQVLGHGGHGTVYKGLLKVKVSSDTTEVAVKRCIVMDEQHKKEFGKEMLILSQINHRNIVKLLGCCLEVEVPMLVYEFVPNGTLFQLIHGSSSNDHHHRRRLSLETRLRIAHESAEALTYLHSWASPPILHGDVKSCNVLLDCDYTAMVSDFGASVVAPTDESQFVTMVQGTCGYLDPEYMQTCQITDKSDVYSFGVVLLELLTGKKAFNLEGPEHEKSLSMRFLAAMKENKLEEILDDQIKDNHDDGDDELVHEMAELAKHCLEMYGENRPPMKEVAEKLGQLSKMMARHPWVQENHEEMESLLGDVVTMSSVVGTSTTSFSIDKEAVKGLESGR